MDREMWYWKIGAGIVGAAILVSLSQVIAVVTEPPSVYPAHFSEPSTEMLGDSLIKARAACVSSGGNFYFHGNVVCEFNRT